MPGELFARGLRLQAGKIRQPHHGLVHGVAAQFVEHETQVRPHVGVFLGKLDPGDHFIQQNLSNGRIDRSFVPDQRGEGSLLKMRLDKETFDALLRLRTGFAEIENGFTELKLRRVRDLFFGEAAQQKFGQFALIHRVERRNGDDGGPVPQLKRQLGKVLSLFSHEGRTSRVLPGKKCERLPKTRLRIAGRQFGEVSGRRWPLPLQKDCEILHGNRLRIASCLHGHRRFGCKVERKIGFREGAPGMGPRRLAFIAGFFAVGVDVAVLLQFCVFGKIERVRLGAIERNARRGHGHAFHHRRGFLCRGFRNDGLGLAGWFGLAGGVQ